MANGEGAIRGSRMGGGPGFEVERGDSAPRLRVAYYCSNAHVTRPAFAMDAEPPQIWDCPRCGNPAGTDAQNPPPPERTVPYKTHLGYAKERRSDADAAALLAEAVADLRARRERGEQVY